MKSIGISVESNALQAFGLVPKLNGARSWVPLLVHPLSLPPNMIPPPTDRGGLATMERQAHFPISSFVFLQPTYTTLDFHPMLTHCLTCLQPQRLSTKPPCSLMWEKPAPAAPMADEGAPKETQHGSISFAPGCQSPDKQLLPLSHPCAVHTTEQADANLYNCKPIRFSHPLLVA